MGAKQTQTSTHARQSRRRRFQIKQTGKPTRKPQKAPDTHATPGSGQAPGHPTASQRPWAGTPAAGKIDQAELDALVARIVILYHAAPEEAREKLLGLVREFATKARRSGLEFGLWWLADVIRSPRGDPERTAISRSRTGGAIWRGAFATSSTPAACPGRNPSPPPSSSAPAFVFDPERWVRDAIEWGFDWMINAAGQVYAERSRPDPQPCYAEFHRTKVREVEDYRQAEFLAWLTDHPEFVTREGAAR